MSILPDSSQWRHEADRIAENEAIAAKSPKDSIFAVSTDVPRDERVCSQPQELYRLPEFVGRTATATELDDACGLLNDLWQMNQEYVGEYTKEAEAYLAVNDQYRPLTELFINWCQTYFASRMQQRNPKDRNHLERYVRLLGEHDDILGRLALLPNSINYVVLSGCTAYVQWLLCQWTKTDTFVPPDIRQLPIALPLLPGQVLDPCEAFIDGLELRMDYLVMFLSLVGLAADDQCVAQIAQMPADELVNRLSLLMADIQEMRPFLIRAFDPLASAITLTGKQTISVAWEWSLADGAANLLLEPSRECLAAGYRVRGTNLPVRVRQDGLLIDGRKPWVTSLIENRIEDINSLALNVYVVEMFYDKLFSLYVQVDQPRVYNEAKEQLGKDANAELGEAGFAAIYQEVASRQDVRLDGVVSPLPSKLPRIRHLRLQFLLTVLEERLGCEVLRGKGSEITVFRKGGKKGILPGHSRNGCVPSITISNLLKRLGISHGEWDDAMER